MKNDELYEIITRSHQVCGVTDSIEYYAKSNFNSWVGITHESSIDAIKDGERHAKVIKAIYPQLDGGKDED